MEADLLAKHIEKLLGRSEGDGDEKYREWLAE
jgi:hypothetical protein